MGQWPRLANYAARRAVEREDFAPCIEPLAQDRRLARTAWRQLPYDLTYQSFLLARQWWRAAMTGVRGLSPSTRESWPSGHDIGLMSFLPVGASEWGSPPLADAPGGTSSSREAVKCRAEIGTETFVSNPASLQWGMPAGRLDWTETTRTPRNSDGEPQKQSPALRHCSTLKTRWAFSFDA
jgi:hypothetical protein